MKLKSKATIIKFRVVLTTGAGRFSHINHVPFRDILNGILNGNSTDFILGGSRITTDGDCSHEIKRCLLLGRKAMINLDSILKNKDITLSNNVHLVKAMVFPVVMYGHEIWTIKRV